MDAEGSGATPDDVEAYIRRGYRSDRWAEVRRLLADVESPRVRVAVLINAGGDWASLVDNVELARIDARDVLVRAFYSDR